MKRAWVLPLRKSGIDRKDIFLVTKIWISNYGYERAKASIDESLRKLQTDYIDLMLLHLPLRPGDSEALGLVFLNVFIDDGNHLGFLLGKGHLEGFLLGLIALIVHEVATQFVLAVDDILLRYVAVCSPNGGRRRPRVFIVRLRVHIRSFSATGIEFLKSFIHIMVIPSRSGR